MDSARQVIRYSVPGGLVVLVAISTYVVARVAWGASLTEVSALTQVATSLTAVAASVPVGFLIYQAYYASYTPLVRSRYVTRDRGAGVLKVLRPETLARLRVFFGVRLDLRKAHKDARWPWARRLRLLEVDEARLTARYKAGPDALDALGREYDVEDDPRSLRRIYADNWYENWYVLRAVLDLLETRGTGEKLKQEFLSLSDVYHALGASRVAVIFGWVSSSIYLALAHGNELVDKPFESAGAALLSGGVTSFLAITIHTTRRSTWNTAQATLRYGLLWCLEQQPEVLDPASTGQPHHTLRPRRELRSRS